LARRWWPQLLGGIGTIGGYFATSELSALLQPYFGWRIMWLVGFPTGLVLVVLSPLLPESARFLIETGRKEEARQMLARYGSVITAVPPMQHSPDAKAVDAIKQTETNTRSPLRPLLGLSIALTLTALAWGFVNFGVLLWLPSSLISEGHSVGLASALIARSTLVAVPTVALITYLYNVWSTKRILVGAIALTSVGSVFEQGWH
jgi:putative MFS transporter